MDKLLVGDSLVIIPSERSVLKNDIELNLSELSYRLLLTLVQNTPNIVSHDELMKAVWPDRVVSDENLKKRISRLRDSLGDSSDNPKYFVAERGLGYRCITTVCKADNTKEEFTEKSHDLIKTKSNKNLFKFITFFLIFITLLTALFLLSSKDDETNSSNIDYEFQAAQYYARFNQKDNDKALSLYQKSIKLNPNKGSINSGLANVYAQGYYQFGKTEPWLRNAIKFAKQSIIVEPNKPWGYQSLGFSFYLKGYFTESISLFEKASELAPNWGVPLAYEALIHLEVGNPIMAYPLIKKAIDKSPNNPEVMIILAQTYQKLSMPNYAKATLEQSLEFNPDYRLSQNYLTELNLITNDDSLSQLITQRDDDKNTISQFEHWLTAQHLLQTGNLQLAKHSFEQAALLGGRYSLPAQVYISVINKDKYQVKLLTQQIENEIEKGNQWPELKFIKGLLLFANNATEKAIGELILAIESGFTLEYRFENISILLSIDQESKFKNVLHKLTQKNRLNRLKRVPR
ncbi:winged helix-turn-helix domain-containing protein [Pseudoalteromonas sp. C2R02]|uniref:winged helix-turn-helix domain-containing protein n=1 Tax=Pseudoalteromonas sp. C2R02 TaxID=2841565 RepID=UPI001C08E858|nr:winged helix-turn-helix domain-containing protein [Pseudoalteromonas sp. C2R02]MBU2971021.1 winged helix-turn-helix domain-containing protein [Pseudoalteromonas sp. C2R02]